NNIFALSVSALAAPMMAVTALTGQGLGTFRLERAHWQVAEGAVSAGTPLAGRSIARAMSLHDAPGGAHLPAARAPRDPSAARPPLGPGDRLVVCVDPRGLPRLLGQAGDADDRAGRWLGALRRFGRVAWRTLGEIDLPVKVCTGVLLGVVLLGVVVFESLHPD